MSSTEQISETRLNQKDAMWHTPAARGHLICFEGIDGTGKTTIAHCVQERLTELGLQAKLVSRSSDPGHDCPDIVQTRLREMARMLWSYPENGSVRVLGDCHLIHFLVSWFHLFDGWVIRPLLMKPTIVLIDTWFYKYVSRFMLKPTFSKKEMLSWFNGLTVPDMVLWLATKPETAWLRKGHARETEADQVVNGFLDQRQQFVAYQTLVQNILEEFATCQQWSRVDATPTTDHVTVASVNAILGRLPALRPNEQNASWAIR